MLQTWQWLLAAAALFALAFCLAKCCYGFSTYVSTPWQQTFAQSSCCSESCLVWVRTLQAIFFVCLQAYDLVAYWEDGYYFIFLTHWALLTQTLYSVCLAISTYRANQTKDKLIPGEEEVPDMTRFTMMLHGLSLPLALTVTIIVWTALTPVWKLCIFNSADDCKHIENVQYVMVHLVNTIVLFATFLDGRLPFRFDMGGWFLAYCTVYSMWTILHFFLKIGKCPSCSPCTLPYPRNECPIYDILDWHKPEQTLLFGSALLFILVPVVLACWVGLATLRDKVKPGASTSSNYLQASAEVPSQSHPVEDRGTVFPGCCGR